MITPSPKICEVLSNAVSSYGVDLLAARLTTKLEDTTFRKSAAVYSVHYQLPTVPGRHLFQTFLRTLHNRDVRDGLSTVNDKLLLFLLLLVLVK
jgi:hypothetical protein